MNMKKWRVQIKGRNYVKDTTWANQSQDMIFFGTLLQPAYLVEF
jgi:hypothetical protein